MLDQDRMIERVRGLCRRDDRLEAALMYGSFARGEGDDRSDIEFYLFVRDEQLPGLDRRGWVEQLAPVALCYSNEFGSFTVIFDNLVRGEFHFEPASTVGDVRNWDFEWLPQLASAVLLDRKGDLRASLDAPRALDRDTVQEAAFLTSSLANWMLMGANVLARGEHARARSLLGFSHSYLIKAVRLLEGNTAHWDNELRSLERELSETSYRRLVACSPRLDPAELGVAFGRTWEWSREVVAELAARHGLDPQRELLEAVSRRLRSALHGTGK